MRILLDENQVGIVKLGDSPQVEVHASALNANYQRQLFPVENVYAQGPGPGTASIGFPHLVVCQGVVVTMNNGALIGAHVSGANDEGMLMDKMSALINENGGPQQISQMYVAYDSQLYDQENGRGVAEKAGRFGFQGKVRVVDTASVTTGDGSYAQFTAMGSQGKCLVEVKDNKEMRFTAGQGQNLVDDLGRNRNPALKVGAQTTVGALQQVKPTSVRL